MNRSTYCALALITTFFATSLLMISSMAGPNTDMFCCTFVSGFLFGITCLIISSAAHKDDEDKNKGE